MFCSPCSRLRSAGALDRIAITSIWSGPLFLMHDDAHRLCCAGHVVFHLFHQSNRLA